MATGLVLIMFGAFLAFAVEDHVDNVNLGVTDRGQAIFSVAPDATGFELELAGADLLNDDRGTLPLGI